MCFTTQIAFKPTISSRDASELGSYTSAATQHCMLDLNCWIYFTTTTMEVEMLEMYSILRGSKVLLWKWA